jgi:hypothetical protein
MDSWYGRYIFVKLASEVTLNVLALAERMRSSSDGQTASINQQIRV